MRLCCPWLGWTQACRTGAIVAMNSLLLFLSAFPAVLKASMPYMVVQILETCGIPVSVLIVTYSVFYVPLLYDDTRALATTDERMLVNRVAAYGMLCDYVIWRRTAASRGVAAAAQEGLSGGSILQQLPEFMLPYAIQVQ